MENAILPVGLLIGLINVVQMTFPQVKGVYAFLLQIVFGIAMGYLHWFGVASIELGVLYAFVASGAYKLSQNIGPSKPMQPNL